MRCLFDIIYEDADLLVVHKPADLVCHPTKGDEYSSLISRARIYLGANGEPRLVNRLDRETSGLVVMAKNVAAARELGALWETRAVRKEYLAIVHGHVSVEHGIIDAPLGKDEASRVAICLSRSAWCSCRISGRSAVIWASASSASRPSRNSRRLSW